MIDKIKTLTAEEVYAGFQQHFFHKLPALFRCNITQQEKLYDKDSIAFKLNSYNNFLIELE